MAETIFYTAVDEKVTIKLEQRKTFNKSDDRSSGAHKWLFQKMAYASAAASNEASGKLKVLSPPTGGGLGKLSDGKSKGGMYKNAALPKSAYSISGRFYPKPHINSVKISNEGDFGSLKKAEVSFTVHSITDLDLCQPFFDLGARLSIKYGWNDAGGAGGPEGKFEGIIYNFTYSVNSEGGFDCISYGMSAGINTLGGDIKAGSDSAGKKTTDASGNEVPAGTIIGEIDVMVANAIGLADNAINADAIGAVKLPSSWGSLEEKDADVVKEEDKPAYYISLEKIVELVNNKVLRAAGGPKFNKLVIKCNKDITKCHVPTTDKLVSGNPLKVLFPGFGNYGTLNFFSTDFSTEFQAGDLSKTMINVNWLKDLLKNMGILTVDAQKSPNKSVGKFLQNILDEIHINSGTRFKLTLVSNPKDETEVFITDSNYVEKKVKPYKITAVTDDSICRSLSLTAKVPSEMAAAAFVANANTYAPMGAVIAGINSTTTAGTTTSTTATTAPAATTDTVNTAGSIIPNTDDTPQQQFETAKKNMDVSDRLTSDNITAMQAAIKRLYVGGSNSGGTQPENEAILFPIDFSCTLDGIEGFIFGNVITCNYLPIVYQQEQKIAFTVTKVEHNIAGNDWTTTLSTVCRLLPTTFKESSSTTDTQNSSAATPAAATPVVYTATAAETK